MPENALPKMPDPDLKAITEQVRWDDLRQAQIFITGGTGFFGRWLVQSLELANSVHQLGAKAWVLSRNSHPNTETTTYIQGDVRNFTFPNQKLTHIIAPPPVTKKTC